MCVCLHSYTSVSFPLSSTRLWELSPPWLFTERRLVRLVVFFRALEELLSAVGDEDAREEDIDLGDDFSGVLSVAPDFELLEDSDFDFEESDFDLELSDFDFEASDFDLGLSVFDLGLSLEEECFLVLLTSFSLLFPGLSFNLLGLEVECFLDVLGLLLSLLLLLSDSFDLEELELWECLSDE